MPAGRVEGTSAYLPSRDGAVSSAQKHGRTQELASQRSRTALTPDGTSPAPAGAWSKPDGTSPALAGPWSKPEELFQGGEGTERIAKQMTRIFASEGATG